MKHIDELKETILNLHGAEATHVESVPMKETFQGETVWEGMVEVFNLQGHPKTDKAYAWMHDTGDTSKKKRHVTVLHLPPVTSPETAVRASIIQEYRNHGTAEN